MIKTTIASVLLLLISVSTYASIFDDCFTSKEEVMSIAQQIRQESAKMGWEIGKIKSISVAGIIKSKRAIYPDSNILVCLKESDGYLMYLMKSCSTDADKPEWHFLSTSKNGWL